MHSWYRRKNRRVRRETKSRYVVSATAERPCSSRPDRAITYFYDVDLIVIFYDITRREPFEMADFWRKKALKSCVLKPLFVVVGTKLDLICKHLEGYWRRKRWSIAGAVA